MYQKLIEEERNASTLHLEEELVEKETTQLEQKHQFRAFNVKRGKKSFIHWIQSLSLTSLFGLIATVGLGVVITSTMSA